MRYPKLAVLTAAALVTCAVFGCGRKASPEAPESYAPSPTQFFQARGQVDGVLLEWQAPDRDASGERLEGPVGYLVQRSLHVKGETPEFETIGEIAPKSQPSRENIGTGQNAAPPVVRYSYLDKSVKPGVEYDYVVIPVGSTGVEGLPGVIARVTFVGERSLVQTYPATVEYEDAVSLPSAQVY